MTAISILPVGWRWPPPIQQLDHCIQATARQGNVLGIVLGATDHPGFIPHRQPHSLGPVELGVLEGGQPNQAVGERRWQVAEDLGVHRTALRAWLQRYRTAGLEGLKIQWAPGQSRRIPNELAPEIIEWVKGGPASASC